jgi:cytochrome c2
VARLFRIDRTMTLRAKAIILRIAATAMASMAGSGFALAGDPVAGKAIFQNICHKCHAALPYTGRIGDANLPAFLANPRRYKPSTAMTFPGLKRKKDIDDVIAYITQGH